MSVYVEIGCSSSGTGRQGGLVFNQFRTAAYIAKGLTRQQGVGVEGCLTMDWLPLLPAGEQGPFTTPQADGAWWYSASRPELAGFAGAFVTSMDISPKAKRKYSTVYGCRPQGRPGPWLDEGYEITFEAELHGATCCAVASGLVMLEAALRGCCDTDQCTGSPMTFPRFVPSTTPTACGPVVLPSETGGVNNPGPWRCLFGAALLGPVEVLHSSGPNCGTCRCAPVTTVQWVIQAQAGMHTEPVSIWQSVIEDPAAVGCPMPCSTCDDPPATVLTDPNCATVRPSYAPSAAVSGCMCMPLFRNRRSTILDTTSYSALLPQVATVLVSAGATPLRNVTLRLWRERPWYTASDYQDCSACSGFSLSYLPAGYKLRVDGRSGRVTAQGPGGDVLDAKSVVSGAGGAPYTGCIEVPCGRWFAAVDYDADNTAPDATIQILTSQIEPV